MFGWGKKDKPNKKKRNVPDVEIHVPELDIDRLELMLKNLVAHVDERPRLAGQAMSFSTSP
jgi:hypothetical protein